MFTQFSKLPPEIRCMIWKCCLPSRIIELGLDLNESRCVSSIVQRKNTIRPSVASVCKEARDVAEQNGAIQYFKRQPGEENGIWLQPKLDTLHLNWIQHQFRYMGSMAAHIRANSDLTLFVNEAVHRETPIPISVMGKPLHFFPSSNIEAYSSENSPFICSTPDYNNGHVTTVWLYDNLPPKTPIDAVLVCVNLHVPEQMARESGLFGLLADAPVQTVAFDDHERLNQFDDLYRSSVAVSTHPDPDADHQLKLVFKCDLGQRCSDWMERVEWIMMAQRWVNEMTGGKLAQADAEEVWIHPKPAVQDGRALISMKNSAFAEHHPWVQTARQKLPILRPMVMFRFCPYRCNEEDGL